MAKAGVVSRPSRGVVAITSTVAVLREDRRRQLAERLKAGSAWIDSDHVFVNEIGAPLTPDTPTQLMPRLVRAAGLPHARLHDLRHVHATTLLLANVPPDVVAARLGHEDAVITHRTYSHVRHGHMADVGEIFAAAVGCS
jgi:integrase